MKSFLTLALCVCWGMSFASSFGINGALLDKDKGREKKIKLEKKYSLKNYHRPISFYSLSSLNYAKDGWCSSKTPFINNFLTSFSEQNGNNETNSGDVYVQSTIRIKEGNTIVLFPYNYKVKSAPLGMFKTPTAPNR
jgi:hypothetical protein